jgi:hypothetical protein
MHVGIASSACRGLSAAHKNRQPEHLDVGAKQNPRHALIEWTRVEISPRHCWGCHLLSEASRKPSLRANTVGVVLVLTVAVLEDV